MKYLLNILVFILVAFTSQAQIYVKPNNTYGTIFNRLRPDSTLLIPTNCGEPTGIESLRSSNQFMSALYFDSCGKKLYYFIPTDSTWSEIGEGTGPYTEVLNDSTIIVGNDTLVITGISALTASKLDSLHIYTASGVEPDTLYEYRQGDSVLVGYIPKGVDALVASDGVSRNGASIKLGQGQEEDGNPAMLQENRVIPLGFNQLVFRGNSSDSITFTSNSINITGDNDGNASIGLVGNVFGIPGYEHWGNFGPGYFDIGGPTSTMQFFSQGSTHINTFDNTSSWGVQSNIMYLALAENSNRMLFTTGDDNATIEFLYSGIDLGDGCKLRATPSIKKLSLEGDLVQINAHLEAHGRIVAQDSITVNNVPTITSGAPLVLNTANGTISQINLDNLLGYKEYVATISQISTNDPVATVLKNTTGTTFTWARSGEGTYTVTAASSLLAANKTVILTGAAAGNGYVVNTTRASDTVISVVVTDTSDGSQVDEGLTETTFIIRIYP